MEDKIEILAEHIHNNQWSGWMKYMFSKCEEEQLEEMMT